MRLQRHLSRVAAGLFWPFPRASRHEDTFYRSRSRVGNISSRISGTAAAIGTLRPGPHLCYAARTIREEDGIEVEMLELIPPARDLAESLARDSLLTGKICDSR